LAAHNFYKHQSESPCFAAGAFLLGSALFTLEQILEIGEEDSAIPVIGFQVVVQAGLLP
jgi:hypothetical protein